MYGEYKSKYYKPHPRKPKTFVIEGVEYPIKEYCETHGLNYAIVNERINSGYPPEVAVSPDKLKRIAKKICANCGKSFVTDKAAQKWCCENCKSECRAKQKKHKPIVYNGIAYTQTEFCKIHGVSVGTFQSRIKRGLTLDEAIQKEFTKTCPICGKEFAAKNTGIKYCSTTCHKRAATGKGPYKKPHTCNCIVCGKEFETIRDDAKTCSRKCNAAWSRIDRNKRYTHLKKIGKFDASITLPNVYDAFDGVCQMCGQKLYFDGDSNGDKYPSIDHIKPISKGGSHTWDNVQLLCRGCNVIKSNN